jgi:hypothetical protein
MHSASGGNSGNENLWHSFLTKECLPSSLAFLKQSVETARRDTWDTIDPATDMKSVNHLKAFREEYVEMI